MNDQDPDKGEVDDGSGAMHDLAGAYLLNAVDARERVRFEQHLTGCVECRETVAELSGTVAELSVGLELEPPPELRGRLLAQIVNEPQNPGAAPEQDELAQRRSRPVSRSGRRWLAGIAAAAAVAVGAVTITQWGQDSPDQAVVAAQDVLEAPDAVRSTERLGPSTVTVVTSASLARSVLVAEEMDAAPQGRAYQLWFVHEDGSAVSAGLMPPVTSESTTLLLEGHPDDAIAVGLTVEPSGGSQQPTSEPIVAVPLEG